jgi:hypothetical protein
VILFLVRLCLEGFLLSVLLVSACRLPGRFSPESTAGFPRPAQPVSPNLCGKAELRKAQWTAELSEVKQSSPEQDKPGKAKQSKTKQNKAKQNKAKKKQG